MRATKPPSALCRWWTRRVQPDDTARALRRLGQGEGEEAGVSEPVGGVVDRARKPVGAVGQRRLDRHRAPRVQHFEVQTEGREIPSEGEGQAHGRLALEDLHRAPTAALEGVADLLRDLQRALERGRGQQEVRPGDRPVARRRGVADELQSPQGEVGDLGCVKANRSGGIEQGGEQVRADPRAVPGIRLRGREHRPVGEAGARQGGLVTGLHQHGLDPAPAQFVEGGDAGQTAADDQDVGVHAASATPFRVLPAAAARAVWRSAEGGAWSGIAAADATFRAGTRGAPANLHP